VLSLLIAYLEDREALLAGRLRPLQARRATTSSPSCADGPGLLALLAAARAPLQRRRVSASAKTTAEKLLADPLSSRRFAALVEGRTERSGQLSLWRLYSFRDLPVELISHVYQLFVKDDASAVYTPPFLVRLMLEEALGWDRLDRHGRPAARPCSTPPAAPACSSSRPTSG
jgi:hypothetical protein